MSITVSFPGDRRVQAEFKGHTVVTDQPEKSGGNDSAPCPFDLFLTSLATCAGYYVLDFCTSRGIATDGISLTQRALFDPEKKMIGKIEQEIVLGEKFPVKYERAVVRAASLCSVKQHLADPPEVEVSTKRP